MTLLDEIHTFVEEYVAKWNAYDVQSLRQLWDSEEETPIYVAEESEPMIGWDALNRYWSVDRSASVRFIKYWDLSAKRAAPDVAIAFYRMNWNVYFRQVRLYPKPIGGQVRVSALLRRKEAGWRLFHYIEAPLAAMIQVRRALEAAVAPELYEILKAKGISP